MNTLARYHAANLPELMEKITRNGIGMDDYLNRFWESETTSNYPPYNLVQLNNHESRLEVALAGFKKEEVKVFTEFGKLHVEGIKEDKETDAVLMIGEIGGPQEVAAGKFAKENMKKPVIAYIAGLTAPKGRVMGHAGAIVSAYGESAVEKVELLKECGVTISKNPSVMGETVKSVLIKK